MICAVCSKETSIGEAYQLPEFEIVNDKHGEHIIAKAVCSREHKQKWFDLHSQKEKKHVR